MADGLPIKVPVGLTSSTYSSKQNICGYGMSVLWAGCPCCHPTDCVKAMTPNWCGLALSFLHPPPDSWRNWALVPLRQLSGNSIQFPSVSFTGRGSLELVAQLFFHPT